MPKNVIISLFTAFALSLLPACAHGGAAGTSPDTGSESSDSGGTPEEVSQPESETEEGRFTFSHGSFEVIDGWHKYDPQSTESKPFFVSDDYDGVGVPDNISVEYGTNRYSKDDPISFGQAIAAQLAQQSQGQTTGEITATGITSDMGDPVLVFNIPMEDCQITQYYICGDHEYIFVHETNFSGSTECDEAAKTIINTFEWNV